jgi:hypothetical protein
MNDYTFEQYDNARETRAWLERFLREHNGSDWRRKLEFSVGDMLTGNLPKAINGETPRIFWYRIRYKGVLVGYADAKVQSIFNGRKVISDLWIIPRFRKQGHFHASFPGLVECTDAAGVCITRRRYELYGGWFESSFGFDWSLAWGRDPIGDPQNSTMYLVTKDAYKDMVRFMIRYAPPGYGVPSNERGRAVFEEVLRELENENTSLADTSNSPSGGRLITPHKR